MMLCDACHKDSCFHFAQSEGRCEGCGKHAVCVNCTAYKNSPTRGLIKAKIILQNIGPGAFKRKNGP